MSEPSLLHLFVIVGLWNFYAFCVFALFIYLRAGEKGQAQLYIYARAVAAKFKIYASTLGRQETFVRCLCIEKSLRKLIFAQDLTYC